MSKPNPILQAQQAMVAKLAAITAPRIYVNPDPAELENVEDYLLSIARVFDAFLLEVGREVASNAMTNTDLGQFTNVLTDALAGNATHEIQQEVEALRQKRAA